METLLIILVGLFVISLFMKVLRKVVKVVLFIVVVFWVYNAFFAEAQALSLEIGQRL